LTGFKSIVLFLVAEAHGEMWHRLTFWRADAQEYLAQLAYDFLGIEIRRLLFLCSSMAAVFTFNPLIVWLERFVAPFNTNPFVLP
jgi:hypothetical protein